MRVVCVVCVVCVLCTMCGISVCERSLRVTRSLLRRHRTVPASVGLCRALFSAVFHVLLFYHSLLDSGVQFEYPWNSNCRRRRESLAREAMARRRSSSGNNSTADSVVSADLLTSPTQLTSALRRVGSQDRLKSS